MKRLIVILVLLGTGLLLTYGLFFGGRGSSFRDNLPFTPTENPGTTTPVADYRFSGPYHHQNLTVFLIHGPTTDGGRMFATLQEALASGKAVLHETGEVGQLQIENLSSEQELFILSGDIVKGGKQDRTLPYDTVVPMTSGKIAVDSFCVEQGRWTKRDKESASIFNSSSYNLSTNALKRAANEPGAASQGAVWQNVSLTQDRLTKKLGDSVKSKASESSLQLTLESPAVASAIAPYRDALLKVPDKHEDVIGYVCVVNGKILSADVYSSPALFRKLWPKLLDGNAVEAFLEEEAGRTFVPATESSVRAFLTNAENGKPSSENVTKRTYVQIRRTETSLLIESCDRSHGNLVLHRNFLNVTPEK